MRSTKLTGKNSQIFLAIKSLGAYLSNYPVFTNLGAAWNFGFIATCFLLIQLVTGFFLSTHYVANADYAFLSVEQIMRNVSFGWLLRYLHANGASFFFLVVYLHILRSIYYHSYTGSRKDTWLVGVLIFILLMVTAFTGYILPWGQMSFWAATVITNLFSSIPICGPSIVQWIWGGFGVSTFTLTRFYSVHFITPFLILALVCLHIVFLHEYGGNNKFRVYLPQDKVRFFPFYFTKDLYFTLFVLLSYFFCIGFYPNFLLHPDNFMPANPKITPVHIVPEWYFLLFYAILRSIPSKLVGIIFLAFALLALILLPYIRSVYIYSIEEYFSWSKRAILFIKPKIMGIYEKGYYNLKGISAINWENVTFWLFVVVCIILSFLGAQTLEPPYLILSRLFTMLYFLFFFLKFFFSKGTYKELYLLHIKDEELPMAYYWDLEENLPQEEEDIDDDY